MRTHSLKFPSACLAQAAHRAGVTEAEMVDLGANRKAGGIKRAIMFPGCADFNPIKFQEGLAGARPFGEGWGAMLYL